MTNQTAMLVAAQGGPYAQVRTGTVSAVSDNQLRVNIAGTTIPASYLLGYNAKAGDLVLLLQQDGSWCVLGALAGVGSNEVLNPSFEDNPSEIVNWTAYDVSGTSSITLVGPVDGAPDGQFYVNAATDGAAATALLYSTPIPVTAGNVFAVSAYVWGTYVADAAETADADLMALWFATAADLYPTTSSADTVIASAVDVPAAPPFSTLSGTVTAPVTGYMRIALRSTTSADASLNWDLAVARRTT
ncbi:hypothetical protein ACFVWX_13295 [Streptomyces sp. NPDC058220]|uniref:hypothetical protein n=1 Tax=Streptomyces sp. NPDC058220 TaxID=3346387 RepID=UPI0036E6E527